MKLGKPIHLLHKDCRGLTALARVRRRRFRWRRLDLMRIHGRAMELRRLFGGSDDE